MRSLLTIIGVLFSLTNGLSETPDWLAPGKESGVSWLGSGTPLKVAIPDNYKPDRAWPVLFYFHGTGGRASTRLMHHFTSGRDYLIIGMSYAEAGNSSLGGPALEKQVAHLARIREVLAKHVRLDGRSFVGGFSKGGWMSDLLTTRGFPTLSGSLIMGAGKMPADVVRTLDFSPTTRTGPKPPVYIGIGQLDANLVYSRRAKTHYRQSGHRVTFDEFLSKGHEPPLRPDSVVLFQWLAIHAHAKPTQTIRTKARKWHESALAHSKTIKDPMQRLLYLEHLQQAPFAALIPDERQALQPLTSKARRHRALQAEVAAETAYNAVATRELAFRRSDELVDLAQQYARVAASHPKTHAARRALLDQTRLRANFRTLRASQAADTSFPEIAVDKTTLQRHFLTLSQLLNSPAMGLSE